MSLLRYESKAFRKMLPRYPLCSAAHFTNLQSVEETFQSRHNEKSICYVKEIESEAHKTASDGRLLTWPGIPVVQMSATRIAPLMFPLCADF